MFVRAFVDQGVNVAIGGAENRDLLAAKDGPGARAKRRKLVDRADVEPMSVYHGSTSSNDRERPDFSDVLVQFLLRACRALRPGVFLEIALRKEEAGAQRLAPRRILDDALLDVVEADPFHPGRGAVQIAGFLAVELDEGGAIIERFLLGFHLAQQIGDRKSTRLNSRHSCAARMPSCA